MSAPSILTFGCRLNAFESEVMRGHAEAGLAFTKRRKVFDPLTLTVRPLGVEGGCNHRAQP